MHSVWKNSNMYNVKIRKSVFFAIIFLEYILSLQSTTIARDFLGNFIAHWVTLKKPLKQQKASVDNWKCN